VDLWQADHTPKFTNTKPHWLGSQFLFNADIAY